MGELKHMKPVDVNRLRPDFYAWGKRITEDEQVLLYLRHEKTRLHMLSLEDTYDYRYCLTGIMLITLNNRRGYPVFRCGVSNG